MTKKAKKVKYMTEYEQDLTWMAMRYAVGRSTVACQNIAKDIAKNSYGKFPVDTQIYQAIDLKKQVEERLSIMPFNFHVSFDVSRSYIDYQPLDRFIEWMDDNNIEHPIDLNIWQEIEYKGNNQYEAIQQNVPNEYSTNSFDDLLVWNHLAKLLDYRMHKFCIILNNDNEEELIEYFEDYFKSSYKKLEYVKEKIAVRDYVSNPYIILPTIKTLPNNNNIVKDNLNNGEVERWCKEHDIELPVSITMKQNRIES